MNLHFNISRPSDQEFCQWIRNDNDISKIENALKTYPDLINIKDRVSLSL